MPNTFIIGVQKAGTTSLHDWICQHPEAFGPMELKDVDYLNCAQNDKKILSRLSKDFAEHGPERVALHSQVNYILFPQTLNKIKRLFPEAKLIILLRDPVERALSAYRYLVKVKRETRPVKEALIYQFSPMLECNRYNCDFTYIEHGLYARQLENVLDLFHPYKVLVLNSEKLFRDPVKIMRTVFRFLEIDENFCPRLRKRNVTGRPRSSGIHNSLTGKSPVRAFITKLTLSWWMPPKKRQLFRKKIIELNTKNAAVEDTDDVAEVRLFLERVFREDQNRLHALIKKLSDLNLSVLNTY